jgi:hypothetical protein
MPKFWRRKYMWCANLGGRRQARSVAPKNKKMGQARWGKSQIPHRARLRALFISAYLSYESWLRSCCCCTLGPPSPGRWWLRASSCVHCFSLCALSLSLSPFCCYCCRAASSRELTSFQVFRIRWEGSEFLLSCTVCFEALQSGAKDGNVLEAISLQAKSSRVVIWSYFVRDKTSRSGEAKLLFTKTNATFTRPPADPRSSKFSYTLFLRSFQAPTNSKSFNPGTLRSSMMLTAVRENLLASARCFGSRISTEFEFLLPSALWHLAWDYIAMVRPARLLRILRFRVLFRRTQCCFPSWLLSSSL